MSIDDVRDHLERTEVVAVVTTRAGGSQVATPVWAMVVDGVPYLRSAFGAGSWWYRHAVSGRPVAIALGDGAVAERDRDAALALPRAQVRVTHVPADDPVQDRIDEELERKYAHAPRSSIDPTRSEEARAATLRIESVDTRVR